MAEATRRGLTAERPPPPSFRRFATAVNPRYCWYRHCEVIAGVLQRVADGELKRVMFFMPPRHSKSETISRLFSAYFLHRFPDRWVGLNSYGADLAYTLSRAARDNYRRAGGPIRDDAAAVKHWETGRGGGMWAAGVGGAIGGKGFHLGIIDDPIKNAEEAASEGIRAKHRDWYGSTFYTRGEPGAAIVVVQTRWHAADLSGWLLEQESADEAPEGWHVVNLEALKEPDAAAFPPSCTVEPDWRATGEALCPERYDAAKLAKIRRRITEFYFGALFQQRPYPREGGLFKRDWFAGKFVDAPPVVTDRGARIRSWDKAATDGGGDWTAGVRMSRAGNSYFIEHVVRGQWSPGARDRVIRLTADADGKSVAILGEQEPGAAGKSDAQAFATMLAGYTVTSQTASGDKATRAGPLASQCEAGNVYIVRGPWVDAFLEELCAFPTGKNDDQVDGASGGFNKLAEPVRRAGVALIDDEYRG